MHVLQLRSWLHLCRCTLQEASSLALWSIWSCLVKPLELVSPSGGFYFVCFVMYYVRHLCYQSRLIKLFTVFLDRFKKISEHLAIVSHHVRGHVNKKLLPNELKPSCALIYRGTCFKAARYIWQRVRDEKGATACIKHVRDLYFIKSENSTNSTNSRCNNYT